MIVDQDRDQLVTTVEAVNKSVKLPPDTGVDCFDKLAYVRICDAQFVSVTGDGATADLCHDADSPIEKKT
jgi:hypothetical protein